MVTDWILVRRAAAELHDELRGTRVTDAGVLDDGRFAVRLAGRRGRPPLTLAVDLFGSPPVVTLEELELSVAGEPGWARAIGSGIRGMRVDAVRSRPGDRVLALDLGTTSRFGVVAGATLILELIPRFGNAVLIRDKLIVAAAKQFSPAENEQRSVTAGGPYRPPPLAEELQLPRQLADSLDAAAAAELVRNWAAGPTDLPPLHAYREAGRLVAVHVVPLIRYADLEHSMPARLLPLWREGRDQGVARQEGDAVERRRAVLARRIAKRAADAAAEVAQVEARRADAAGRDRLRAAGDALHTYGGEIPPGATRFVPPVDGATTIELDPELDAKGNAARYFARYRKASDALPHLERRSAVLTAKRDTLEDLAFEVERADAGGLADVAAILAGIEGKPQAPPSRRMQRRPLQVERPSGARIYVGRSPSENVEVTFRIARPADLWFHARGIPGSHVVLQPPPGAMPVEEDLDCAADLAALHSRARNAPRVEIDFTERKYVRRQRDGAPGRVWYTNARTRVGRPDQVPV